MMTRDNIMPVKWFLMPALSLHEHYIRAQARKTLPIHECNSSVPLMGTGSRPSVTKGLS